MGYDQSFIEIRNSFGYGTSKHIFRNNIQISAPQVSRNISSRRFLQLRRVNIFFLFIWMRLFCHFVIDFLQSYINKPLKSKYHLFIHNTPLSDIPFFFIKRNTDLCDKVQESITHLFIGKFKFIEFETGIVFFDGQISALID